MTEAQLSDPSIRDDNALRVVPDSATCPVCSTIFDPRDTGGTCPVCGEQVVPADLMAAKASVLSRVGRWLREGGWRVVLVVLLLLYQVILFIIVWHGFVVAHVL
jgi:hypothetical protein